MSAVPRSPWQKLIGATFPVDPAVAESNLEFRQIQVPRDCLEVPKQIHQTDRSPQLFAPTLARLGARCPADGIRADAVAAVAPKEGTRSCELLGPSQNGGNTMTIIPAAIFYTSSAVRALALGVGLSTKTCCLAPKGGGLTIGRGQLVEGNRPSSKPPIRFEGSWRAADLLFELSRPHLPIWAGSPDR